MLVHSVHHVPYIALFADRCGTFVGQNLLTHYLHYETQQKGQLSARSCAEGADLVFPDQMILMSC